LNKFYDNTFATIRDRNWLIKHVVVYPKEFSIETSSEICQIGQRLL
jgi:hypothetical protein